MSSKYLLSEELTKLTHNNDVSDVSSSSSIQKRKNVWLGRLKQYKQLETHQNEERLPEITISTKSEIFHPIILEWLQHALQEGHLEPSQPKLGCLLGWPNGHKILVESLCNEVECWAMKENYQDWEMPSQKEICLLADKVFSRDGWHYTILPLETCQHRYREIIQGGCNEREAK